MMDFTKRVFFLAVVLGCLFMMVYPTGCALLSLPDTLRAVADSQDEFQTSVIDLMAQQLPKEEFDEQMALLTAKFKDDLKASADSMEEAIKADGDMLGQLQDKGPAGILTALLTYWGVNARRDSRRTKRGEKV